jgi:hypothetical protein
MIDDDEKDEARQTILQRVATIRPKGYTDERWLAHLADAHRLKYGLKWEERERFTSKYATRSQAALLTLRPRLPLFSFPCGQRHFGASPTP